jgi:hypothetical protein
MTCNCNCDGATFGNHLPPGPVPIREAVEAIALWAGVDPVTLVDSVLRDWLARIGLLDLPETAPLNAIDWTHARVLRRRNKTEDSYSSWRRDGNQLTDCEPTPPEYRTP